MYLLVHVSTCHCYCHALFLLIFFSFLLPTVLFMITTSMLLRCYYYLSGFVSSCSSMYTAKIGGSLEGSEA